LESKPQLSSNELMLAEDVRHILGMLVTSVELLQALKRDMQDLQPRVGLLEVRVLEMSQPSSQCLHHEKQQNLKFPSRRAVSHAAGNHAKHAGAPPLDGSSPNATPRLQDTSSDFAATFAKLQRRLAEVAHVTQQHDNIASGRLLQDGSLGEPIGVQAGLCSAAGNHVALVATGPTSPTQEESAVALRHFETAMLEPSNGRANLPGANGVSCAVSGTAAAVDRCLIVPPGGATVTAGSLGDSSIRFSNTAKLAGSGKGIHQQQARGNASLLARGNSHTQRSLQHSSAMSSSMQKPSSPTPCITPPMPTTSSPAQCSSVISQLHFQPQERHAGLPVGSPRSRTSVEPVNVAKVLSCEAAPPKEQATRKSSVIPLSALSSSSTLLQPMPPNPGASSRYRSLSPRLMHR